MNGLSLFSSAGIGEYNLKNTELDIVLANELIPERAELYKNVYKNSKMIIGDISDLKIFNRIHKEAREKKINFIIASPPCQGISIAGKNRKVEEMSKDSRNYLVTHVIELIKLLSPSYATIENVPQLLKLKLFINSNFLTIEEYLNLELSNDYNIETKILDTADYGVPQTRKRAIIVIYKKGQNFTWPSKVKDKITVKDVIGDLPTLESGEFSNIKWHYARNHVKRHIQWMKHTPTGSSAFDNEFFFPKKKNGKRLKGYNSSYRRIRWDTPAPTITIRSDAVSSQRNVHPGNLKEDGTYSNARVLSPLELMRLTGLPDNWEIPEDTSELLIRRVLGECIPPKLLEEIVKGMDLDV